MGLLDWFKNRPAQFDSDRVSDEMTKSAIEKAITLINPRLKLVRSYQERLASAVDVSIRYLRERVHDLPEAIRVSASGWAFDPALRAFFVAPTDISNTIGRSNNLRTLFEKYPDIDEAQFILGMGYSELSVPGMSMQGEIIQRDIAQTVISFSNHQARICGRDEMEVRRLLGAQAYEYLVVQALSEIGEERSERRELEDNRAVIRARLRLLQQQGPGLGSVFGSAPSGATDEQRRLETLLLDNERQIEAMGDSQAMLESELDCLRSVLEHPERYVQVEKRQMRLSTMNVVLDDLDTDVALDIAFALAHLSGVPRIESAFILASYARDDMSETRIDFGYAERYL